MVITSAFAFGLLSALVAQGPGTGSICVNRFGPDPPQPCPTGTADLDVNPVPEFRWESSRFTIQVDQLPKVEISCYDSAVILKVPLGIKHKVRIWVGSRQLETFFFTFEQKRADRLCLDFAPYYGTWQLEAYRHGTTKPCTCTSSREQ